MKDDTPALNMPHFLVDEVRRSLDQTEPGPPLTSQHPSLAMHVDETPPDKKKKRHGVGSAGEDTSADCKGIGSLPSKEQVASKGLEAKVDMATHGQKSWALTHLGSWRDQSLTTEKSAEFVKNRQREARKALLLGAAGGALGAHVAPVLAPPAKPPEGCSNMDL